jgi:pseudaminic acid biosynthesis-associated methylase
MKAVDFWRGPQGQEYTSRNPRTPEATEALYANYYGMTRTEMNKEFVGGLPKDIRILEVGCNIGMQLVILNRMGFNHLYGIDVQLLEKADCFAFKLAPAQAIPFKDGYFDLVVTNGLLIHIPEVELGQVVGEICRVTKRYVWGFEYFSPTRRMIPYQGQNDLLWADDYCAWFKNRLGFREVKEKLYPYITEAEKGKQDSMYILERCR